MNAEEWNEKHPIGTPVIYYPLGREPETWRHRAVTTRTRSHAWTLGSGETVVAVENVPGGVALTHLDIVIDAKADLDAILRVLSQTDHIDIDPRGTISIHRRSWRATVGAARDAVPCSRGSAHERAAALGGCSCACSGRRDIAPADRLVPTCEERTRSMPSPRRTHYTASSGGRCLPCADDAEDQQGDRDGEPADRPSHRPEGPDGPPQPYRAENRDRIGAQKRGHYRRNRDRMLAARRAYYAETPEEWLSGAA